VSLDTQEAEPFSRATFDGPSQRYSPDEWARLTFGTAHPAAFGLWLAPTEEGPVETWRSEGGG
jgi:hypothetical protein